MGQHSHSAFDVDIYFSGEYMRRRHYRKRYTMDRAQRGLACWAFLCLLLLLSFCYRNVWCNLVLSQTYFGNRALGMTNLSAAEMAFSFVDSNYGYYLKHAGLPGEETDGEDLADENSIAGGENMTDGQEAADGTGQTEQMDTTGNADGTDIADGTNKTGKPERHIRMPGITSERSFWKMRKASMRTQWMHPKTERQWIPLNRERHQTAGQGLMTQVQAVNPMIVRMECLWKI